jgi:hypothetical protein
VQEPYETSSIKGFTLVEIAGRDLLTWRLVHDARPGHVCVIDSANISPVSLVDEAGPIPAAEIQQNQWRTVISFEAHSALYSMIYWRYGFVEEAAGRYHLVDNWHAVEPRVFLWAFPPGIVVDQLQPPALQAALSAWGERIYTTALATRITADVTFHLAGPGEVPTPARAATPPNLKTLTALMPPTPGLPLILERVRAHCAATGLLRASRVIVQLMGL